MYTRLVLGGALLAASLSGSDAAAGATLRLRGGDRQYFIAGNWKLNPATLDEAKTLAQAIVKSADGNKRDQTTAICCPYPYLASIGEICKGSKVSLGAEDCCVQDKGAFTGGVSTSMLKSCGVEFVLVGHSERRHGNIASETDAEINAKIRKILDAGLKPVLCVGETKEEYEGGLCNSVCSVQLTRGLAGVTKEEMSKITIAYEPVWAIGTGLVATPEVAQATHSYIRSWLAKMYDEATAAQVVIQYGGSVAPDNVDTLMACPDIDGALVGGASLIPDKFDKIVNFK